MRHLFTLIFATGLLTTFGQTKSLTGIYADSLTTHKIILDIQDNGKFTTDEFMSEGKRTLFGTWTLQGNLFTFKTNKIWYWDKKKPNEKREFTPKDFPDTFASVDKDKRLTLLAPKNTEALDVRLRKIK